MGDSLLQWWLSTNAKEVNEASPFLRKLQELSVPFHLMRSLLWR
ncbi:Conserved hypothetical protein [Prochlorococcus marinus str. MIT 9303]|uniref:Uncharacterized protein n=1 Tax=Prochlorococcus marinus (strain MIT 9303) TaxID=59922 RepID=A2C8G6_PROM3|nr:Conserved hypothetical protein [Prochlorococcus marinus str. MIT 9303]